MGLFLNIFLNNVNNINMINYYEKSKKEFIKYINENPNVSRKEWDEYAHENCLFSAFTICCHEIDEITLMLLQAQSKSEFEFLKEKFTIKSNKHFNFLRKAREKWHKIV